MIDILRDWAYNYFVRLTACGRAEYNPEPQKRNSFAQLEASRIKIAPGCAGCLPDFQHSGLGFWTAIGNGTAKGNFALKGRVVV
jgi:hypothetical protein